MSDVKERIGTIRKLIKDYPLASATYRNHMLWLIDQVERHAYGTHQKDCKGCAEKDYVLNKIGKLIR